MGFYKNITTNCSISKLSIKQIAIVFFLALISPAICLADVSNGTTTNNLDPAETGYDFIIDDIYYKIIADTAVSTSEGENPYVGKIVIPDEVQHGGVTYKVTKVSGFKNSPDVTEVTIPKYTKIISAFYGAASYWYGGSGIKSPLHRTAEAQDETEDTEDTAVVSKLTKIYFNAENCQKAYYSHSSTSMLGGGYSGYQNVFPATVTSIEFGDNVTRIPDGLLMRCPEIKELVFPKSVRYIGWKIIDTENDNIINCQLLCEDLQEIAWLPVNQNCVILGPDFHTYPCGKEHCRETLLNGYKDSSKYSNMFHNFIGLWNDSDGSANLPEWVRSIAPNAFANCDISFPLSISLPETLTSISPQAFKDCSILKEITIPTTVTEIGEDAFYGCKNLKTVYFNAIECNDPYYNPFYECNSLRSVIFGEGVTRIPGYMFADLNKLEQITLPDSLNEIGEEAFRKTGIKELTIPESVTSIGYGAFMKCSKLTTLYYDAIDCAQFEFSFSDCTSLTSVIFGNKVRTIPDYFLAGCNKITEVNLPSTINYIGYSAFASTGITEITIPESVKEIDESFGGCEKLETLIFNAKNCAGFNAFDGCVSLKNVTFGDSVTNIPDYFLCGTAITEITIPASVTQIGDFAFSSCKSLETINFNAENYNPECHSNNIFQDCPSINKVNIGEKVTVIPENFLKNFGGNITELTLPNSITYIGYYAFIGLNISTLTIPESLTYLGYRAFDDCTKLKTVYFNAKRCYNAEAFSGCDSLSNVILGENVEYIEGFKNCPNLTNVKLSESLTMISDEAFRNTGVTCITIPNSVARIGWNAFTDSKLTEVTIGSGVTFISEYVFTNCPLENITVLCETPPGIYDSTFDERTFQNATLIVPDTSLERYKHMYVWKNFYNIKVFDISGIESVETQDVRLTANNGMLTFYGIAPNTVVSVYTIDGTEVAKTTAAERETLTLSTGLPKGCTAIVNIGTKSVKVIM